jgi:hypothetical protein
MQASLGKRRRRYGRSDPPVVAIYLRYFSAIELVSAHLYLSDLGDLLPPSTA